MPTWAEYRTWLGDVSPSFTQPSAEAPAPDAFVTDTRTLAKDQWFVPLDGAKFDGHAYLQEAMTRGARGFFFAEKRRSDVPESIRARGIAVTDPLAAMQAIGKGWRLTLKNLKLLALTGSTGKTTTKEMLTAVLRAAGPTFGTEASFNNEIGVPKSLLSLKPEHRYAAVEMGARKAHDIRFLVEMADPDVGAVLNVGKTHIEVFGSVETLLATKLEMFRNSAERTVLAAFGDDPRIVGAARESGKEFVTFGMSGNPDVLVQAVEWLPADEGMRVHLRLALRDKRAGAGGAVTAFGNLAIHLGVAHAAFPINVAAAAAMSLAAGIRPESIAKGLDGFTNIKGRYQVHRIGATTVIDDSYNASPDSMKSGLSTLSRSYAGSRFVLVLGDMLELGDHAVQEHQKVGALAAELKPELLITVGAAAKDIVEGAIAAGLPHQKARGFEDVETLLKARLPLTQKGEVVYVKASRGIRLDRLVEALVPKDKP